MNEWFERGTWTRHQDPGDIWILWYGYAHPSFAPAWFDLVEAS